ncbi:MAG TPA: tetratricopeptide repeat protein [Chroococcidiopsis sp.]
MLPILLAIAALLCVFAFPYLVAIWNVRHTVMRRMHIEPAQASEMPEALKVIFKDAIAELKQHGFTMASCHLIEDGAEKDGKQWGILLRHSSQHTYAGLMMRPLVNSAAPLTSSFLTLFQDDTLLTTINSQYFGIYSPDPKEISQCVGAIAIADQWQAHTQKLAELFPNKPPQILSPANLLSTLESRNLQGMERLVRTGEVQWVEPGERYRMSWPTAARAVYRVASKSKKVTAPAPIAPATESASQTGFPATSTPVTAASQHQAAQPTPQETPSISSPSDALTPAVELEIAEFHRLQQKSKTGISKGGKNWLLLGTLALFIVSYSTTFDPIRLLIFVAVLLLHEGGHVLAMKIFGYRDTVMLFIPFLGALATARKDNASLTEKVWISLAGPLPGLVLGIGLAIAFGYGDLSDPNIARWFQSTNWIRETSWMLIILNLFNLLPVYPLDGGQVADLLVFSRHPYVGVGFKGIGVFLLGLLGLGQPLLLIFAGLIALSLPASFRLAQLNARFRRDLRTLPHDDRDRLLQFLFTQLQAAPYRNLPFVQKYQIVVALLDSHREGTAKWSTRLGLAVVYLVSLLAGLLGGLYAIMPNRASWNTMIGTWVDPEGTYEAQMQQNLEQVNQALKDNPDDAQSYLQRGQIRMSMGDTEGAIADVDQVLKLDPNSGEAYQLRGFLHQSRGDQAQAEADLSKGMELLATQELESLNQTLRQSPRNTDAYFSRASLYLRLQRYPDAIADYNQILLIDPQNTQAVIGRGEGYLGLNQYPEALGNANHALRLNPNSGNAYDLRSRIHRQMGNETEAIADTQKAQALYQTQDSDSL